MKHLRIGAAVFFSAIFPTIAFADVQAMKAPAACNDDSAHLIDFTVGTWKVTTKDGTVDGHNKIERVLGGCAVIENWEGTTAGDVGKSLFWYDARSHRWMQTWVRPDTSEKGELVHYDLVKVYPDKSVRFDDTRFNPKGVALLERTTLTPMKNGNFGQFIEVSRDGGNTWVTAYDAVYSPESDADYKMNQPVKDDPMPCRNQDRGKLLDFWVGNWRVTDSKTGSFQGTDRVDSTLDGCAVFENWKGADAGDEGKSLFTYNARTHQWDQVWVTLDTSQPGGLKYKRMVGNYPDGSTRFQGDLDLPDGRIVLDRTTLTPMKNGTVHQVIAISRDGGDKWLDGFDAIYTREK